MCLFDTYGGSKPGVVSIRYTAEIHLVNQRLRMFGGVRPLTEFLRSKSYVACGGVL